MIAEDNRQRCEKCAAWRRGRRGPGWCLKLRNRKGGQRRTLATFGEDCATYMPATIEPAQRQEPTTPENP